MATGNQFSEPEPSFEEGRTLLNGSTLDENNQVVQSLEFATSQQIEEENKERMEEEKFDRLDHVDDQMLMT